MDCHEARQLLDRGALPGTRTAEHALLGFHLARCPACRHHRERLDGSSVHLLAHLLTDTPWAQPAQRPAARTPTPVYRVAVVTVLVLLVVASGWLAIWLGRTTLAALSIRNNIQAMIVTQVPSTQPSPVESVPALYPSTVLTPATATSQPLATPALTPTPSLPPTPTLAPTPDAGAAITVLLIGNDQRLDEVGPARADSIMLARIDPARQRVALLSLTRDLMVEIPGHGYARINSANVYGGPELMQQTVSHVLQIPIDYFVAINFAGFIEAVDALGGVTVQVDKEIYQPGWELHFLPGPVHMDGLTALRYSRIRMPDSDYERVKRQQSVLLAIVARVREQHPIESLESLAALTEAVRGYVQTNMPEERILALAWALRDFSLDSVERYSLEGSMVSTGVIPGDYYAQVPNPGVIESLRHRFLDPDEPVP